MLEQIAKIKFMKKRANKECNCWHLIFCHSRYTIILNPMHVGIEGKTRRDQFIKVGGNLLFLRQ